MSLKGKLKQLEKAVRGDRDYLDLRDGTRFYFEPMRAHAALYMRQMEAMRKIYVAEMSEGADGTETPPPTEPYAPEILEALSMATPDSLRRFERYYGPAERGAAVIHDNDTITIRTIAVDGTATTQELEGEEAEEYRASVRAGWS